MLTELSLRRVVLLAIGVFFFFSCAGSNPGTGTQTLYVKAQAITNGSTDGSWMAVEVREGSADGQLVTNAVVSITGDQTGDIDLPWDGVQVGNFKMGAYRKAQLVWDSAWMLHVSRGADRVDAYLQAPGVTTIVAPLAGTTFVRADGLPLDVTWKDDAGRRAEQVELTLDHADQASITLPIDTLEHQVEANRLIATDKERLGLKRKNQVDLAGGAPGSLFSATTEHSIEFAVQ